MFAPSSRLASLQRTKRLHEKAGLDVFISLQSSQSVNYTQDTDTPFAGTKNSLIYFLSISFQLGRDNSIALN